MGEIYAESTAWCEQGLMSLESDASSPRASSGSVCFFVACGAVSAFFLLLLVTAIFVCTDGTISASRNISTKPDVRQLLRKPSNGNSSLFVQGLVVAKTNASRQLHDDESHTADDVFPHVISGNPFIQRPKIAKGYKRKYDVASCVGLQLAISLWTANVVVKAMTVSYDCKGLSGSSANQQATCARDIFALYRAIFTVATLLSKSVHVCGVNTGKQLDTDCSTGVLAANKGIGALGQLCSQLQTHCTGTNPNYMSCEGRVESIAWNANSFSDSVSFSVYSCTHLADRHPHYCPGACVGNVIATLGYLGASGLALSQATITDCNRTSASYSKLNCAEDISSFVRTMFLAASFADRAAGHCSDNVTMCGHDITRSASAFAAVAQAGAMVDQACNLPQMSQSDKERCSASSSTLVKELAVAVAYIMDASNSCSKTAFATTACGSATVKALASFAYLVEQASLAAGDCPGIGDASNAANRYSCGQDIQHMGDASFMATSALGQAALNCMVVAEKGAEARPVVSPLQLGRRFWVPQD